MTSRRTVLGAIGAASIAGTAKPPGKDLHAYERFVADRAAQDLFSGTILVAHNGRTVLTRSYGAADRERMIPNRAGTVYWLASVTKMFTALAVLRLVQQGRLNLYDPVGAHLDGFPADATVHHLLTHTSGIGRPALGRRDPAEAGWTTFDEMMDGTLAIIRRTPQQFPAGARFTYSNDGFVVLGAVVAAVAGRSYFDHVREDVFAATGMVNADFVTRPGVLADDRIARPYFTQPGGTRADFAASPYAPFTVGPPGGAYATAADLLAFARSLTAGTSAFTDVMTAGKVPVPPPADPPSRAEFYGYGTRESILGDTRIFGHSGSGPGAATRLDVFPRSGRVSIVLSNYDTTIAPIVAKARETLR